MATGRTKRPKVLQFGILVFFAIIFLYPILWLFINSFKSNSELFISPWTLPKSLSADNYARAIGAGSIGQFFINSVMISASVVVITTLLSAMSAYGLTRLRWRLSGAALSVMLLGIMIPQHATIVPLFSIFNALRINNTPFAVIIPNVVFTLSMGILILSGFFVSIPKEMEEASVIDGCSVLSAFFRIIWPITTGSLVTVAVITFIPVWNDLLFPQIFLVEPRMMTLPVGLNAFKGRYSTDYVGMIAAVVITILPSIVVYIMLHKRIVEGMTAGAVKG
jgi:raffinose/stachyose/melibiose transport system permease protein